MNDIVKLQERMHKYKSDCGCSMGGIVMTTAFIITTGWSMYKDGFFSIHFLATVPRILLVSFIAAGIGKAAGLLYAHLMYKKIYNRLNRINSNKKNGGTILCREHGLK
jgi:hypothetical protein